MVLNQGDWDVAVGLYATITTWHKGCRKTALSQSYCVQSKYDMSQYKIRVPGQCAEYYTCWIQSVEHRSILFRTHLSLGIKSVLTNTQRQCSSLTSHWGLNIPCRAATGQRKTHHTVWTKGHSIPLGIKAHFSGHKFLCYFSLSGNDWIPQSEWWDNEPWQMFLLVLLSYSWNYGTAGKGWLICRVHSATITIQARGNMH